MLSLLKVPMKKVFYTLVLPILCLLYGVAYCQPVGLIYANSATGGGSYGGSGEYEVINPSNAVSQTSLTDYTRLYAKNSTLSEATAFLQMTFPTSVPANSTIYVKTTLSAMSLLLAGGGVSISYATTAGTVNVNASDLKTYYTGDGNIYFSIKLANVLQSLKITAKASGVLAGSITLDIFYAFYGSEVSNDSYPFSANVSDCGSANYTTFSTSGLTLGSFGVNNPGGAIDQFETTTNSSFYATGLSLITGKIAQTFYFNGISNASDAVRIVFSQSASLVAVNLAKSVTLTAYKGTNKVGESQSLFALLDVDLLGLLGQSESPSVVAYMAPKNSSNVSVTFDRIVVELDIGALGVGLGNNGLNIMDVRRVPDVPVTTNVTACTNLGKVSLLASTVQQNVTSFTYTWYSALRGGTLLSALSGNNPLLSGLISTGQSNYYVDITKSGCTVPSGRTKVTVTTVNPPVSPPVALTP